MEVTLLTNNIATPKQNLSIDTNSAITEENLDIKIKKENMPDVNEVLMDINEMQDYLFMLMGLPSPGKTKDGKGAKIDLVG